MLMSNYDVPFARQNSAKRSGLKLSGTIGLEEYALEFQLRLLEGV